MNFNTDPTKKAHKVTFSPQSKKIYHPPLVFNNNIDSKLISDKHLKTVSIKISKTLGLF